MQYCIKTIIIIIVLTLSQWNATAPISPKSLIELSIMFQDRLHCLPGCCFFPSLTRLAQSSWSINVFFFSILLSWGNVWLLINEKPKAHSFFLSFVCSTFCTVQFSTLDRMELFNHRSQSTYNRHELFRHSASISNITGKYNYSSGKNEIWNKGVVSD